MRFLLRAAYVGTYSAAASTGSQHLYLTCAGGGVFQNPLSDIAEEIADAHCNASRNSKLTTVFLPLYPVNADPSKFVAALRKRGVEPTVVHHHFDRETETFRTTREKHLF